MCRLLQHARKGKCALFKIFTAKFLSLQIFVIDGYAGWDEEYRIKTRVISVRPYHALFMKQMLIRGDL